MNSNKAYLVQVTLLAGLLALIFFTAYCMHFNADLTDEGFYLYLFQHGSETVTFNFYHLFLSPLGILFDHSLLGYRYLSMAGILLAAGFLIYSIEKKVNTIYYTIAISSGLLYFNLISTFSYNTLVLICSALVLALKYIDSRDPHWRYQALIGICCFFAFSARYGSGLFLLILVIVINFFTMSKSQFLKSLFANLLSFCVPLLVTYYFWENGFQEMKQILAVATKSSHQNLVGKYLLHLGRYLGRAFLPALFIVALGNRYFSKKKNWALLLYLLWFIVAHLIRDYNFTSFWYYASGLFLALAFFELRKLFQVEERTGLMLFLIFPTLVYLGSCLGTNNNIFKASSYNALLLFPVFYYFMNSLEATGKAWFAGSFLLLSASGIYHNQYFQSYRSIPRDQQNFVRSRFHSLRGIYIDKTLEERLDSIDQKFKVLGLGKHKVLSYPNLPGIPAYLGLTALGNPWNTSKYPNSDLANCVYIEKEEHVEKLFIYAEEKLTSSFLDCINEKADQVIFI